MLLDYAHPPLLVDISDATVGTTVVRRRARRKDLRLPDTPSQPCSLEIEVIPYARLADGGYGDELRGGVFRRDVCLLAVSNQRLVEAATGQLLASRYLADGSLQAEADWQTEVARVAADPDVTAMRQADWFCQMLRQVPVVVDAFIEQYIRLADASGDLG